MQAKFLKDSEQNPNDDNNKELSAAASLRNSNNDLSSLLARECEYYYCTS